MRLSQFWLQALYGLVILIAVALDAVLVVSSSVGLRTARTMTGVGGARWRRLARWEVLLARSSSR